MALVVGVDLGTQSCKAVVCGDDLAVRGAHQVALSAGGGEQDPAEWERALAGAITGALAAARVRPGDVTALAIAGQLDGCVAVDAAGRALHPALIWQDRRAVAETALVDPDRVHAITGQIADPSHLAPKLAWLRGRVAAARYHVPVSYLVERLTGTAAIDPAHASTTMLYDLAAGTWSRELCAAFAIDPSRELPAVAPTCAIAGALHASGAALTGLPVGTPVAVGTGDDFATPLGAGIAAPGPVAVALGTAEVVGAIATTPIFDRPAARSHAPTRWRTLADPMVETHAFPTGAYFIEHPGWLSGGAIRWATRLLGVADDAALDRLAASTSSDGVTFVPALAGAMTPTWRPEQRAALHGLAARHGPAHIARAVLEGLAFACRDVVDRLAALGLPTHEVIALGGGSASATWLQLRADILGRPHRVAARADSSAIGAAMIAAVAIGHIADLHAAAALAPPPVRTFAPAAERSSLDQAYERYQDLVR